MSDFRDIRCQKCFQVFRWALDEMVNVTIEQEICVPSYQLKYQMNVMNAVLNSLNAKVTIVQKPVN